jgi:hypothetical protein
VRKKLGNLPGAEVELLPGLAVGGVRRSKAAGVLGLGWRPRGGGIRVQGSGVLFVGRRLPSTCGPGVEGSPEISGARVRPVMRGKKKGEGERALPGGVGESEREVGNGPAQGERGGRLGCLG